MEAEGREVCDRLVEVPDEFLEGKRVLCERELELCVIRAQRGGDLTRVGQLGAGIFPKPDCKRLDRLAHVPSHISDDQTGVESPRQHGSERHVAHQPQADGLVELRDKPFRRLVHAHGRGIGRGMRPVALLPHGRIDHEHMARKELGDVLERRLRCGEVAEREIRVDRVVVESRLDQPAGEQGFQLGGEDDQVASDGVVERLDPEAVACEDEAPSRTVPDGDREHPAQSRGEARPVLLIEMRDDLRIATGLKPMPGEVASDVEMVVELAVLDGPHRAVLVGKRLVASLDVDDRKPSDAQRDSVGQVRPAVGRASVGHPVGHAIEHLG